MMHKGNKPSIKVVPGKREGTSPGVFLTFNLLCSRRPFFWQSPPLRKAFPWHSALDLNTRHPVSGSPTHGAVSCLRFPEGPVPGFCSHSGKTSGIFLACFTPSTRRPEPLHPWGPGSLASTPGKAREGSGPLCPPQGRGPGEDHSSVRAAGGRSTARCPRPPSEPCRVPVPGPVWAGRSAPAGPPAPSRRLNPPRRHTWGRAGPRPGPAFPPAGCRSPGRPNARRTCPCSAEPPSPPRCSSRPTAPGSAPRSHLCSAAGRPAPALPQRACAWTPPGAAPHPLPAGGLTRRAGQEGGTGTGWAGQRRTGQGARAAPSAGFCGASASPRPRSALPAGRGPGGPPSGA